MDAKLVAKLLGVACSNGPDGERLAALGRIKALVGDAEWYCLLKDAGISREDMQRIYDAGYERGATEAKQEQAAPYWSDMRGLEHGRNLTVPEERHLIKTTESDGLWFAAVYMPSFCSTDPNVGAIGWFANPICNDDACGRWQWWQLKRHFATEADARSAAGDLIMRSRADLAAKRARFQGLPIDATAEAPQRRGLFSRLFC